MQIAKRTVAALATASAVVCALIYAPFWAVKAAIVALALLVQLEFSQMVSRKYPIMVAGGVAAGAVFLVSRLYFFDSCFVPIVFALALAALFGKSDKPVGALATTVLGLIYIPFMLQHLVLIAEKSGGGAMMLLYIVAIIKVSDMGGFAAGMAFGRHKMCPSISPGKSWEGLAGSIAASMLVSYLFIPLTGFAAPKALAFGLAAALAGTLGDLVESRMKRECGVKDSATFMPAGMGGFLDMFDSVIFAPALLASFI